MNQGYDINLSFLNFGKAFDIVNHRITCTKLAVLGDSNHLVTKLRNFIAARTSQVNISYALSNEAFTPNGVPQGFVIGLLLFLITINDLLGELQLVQHVR